MEKKALIIYAHPNAKSFCGSIRDLTIKQLETMGFTTIESDLYQMNFNPVLTFKDIKADTAQKGLSISDECKKVVETKQLEPDVQAEIDKINSASYLIFIAPTWWGSFPAILKGWFDRVLLKGAAFDVPDNVFEQGYLKGKKCMIVTTTGWTKDFFSKEGKIACGQTIEENYWHIVHGTFAFCGMETLPVFAFYGLDVVNAEEREKEIKRYEQALGDIEKAKTIPCPLLNNGK